MNTDRPTYTNPALRYLGLELRPYVRMVLEEKDLSEAYELLVEDDESRDGPILNALERDHLDELLSQASEVADDTGLFGEALERELRRREADEPVLA